MGFRTVARAAPIRRTRRAARQAAFRPFARDKGDNAHKRRGCNRKKNHAPCIHAIRLPSVPTISQRPPAFRNANGRQLRSSANAARYTRLSASPVAFFISATILSADEQHEQEEDEDDEHDEAQPPEQCSLHPHMPFLRKERMARHTSAMTTASTIAEETFIESTPSSNMRIGACTRPPHAAASPYHAG